MAASGRVTVKISDAGWKEADTLLSQLPISIRGKELGRAMNAGGRLVIRRAKQLVPKPGYPGDKTRRDPELTPLRDTIVSVLRNYRGGAVMGLVIGPYYAQHGGGNHGHNVELGHRIGKAKTGSLAPIAGGKRKTAASNKKYGTGTGQHIGNVPPHPFMAPAWVETKDKFEPVIMDSLRRSIMRTGG